MGSGNEWIDICHGTRNGVVIVGHGRSCRWSSLIDEKSLNWFLPLFDVVGFWLNFIFLFMSCNILSNINSYQI